MVSQAIHPWSQKLDVNTEAGVLPNLETVDGLWQQQRKHTCLLVPPRGPHAA